MPTITVQPYVLKDAVFSVETDEYQHHVSGVVFTPTSSQITWIGITPASAFSDTATPTWTCVVNYAQDWTTVDSFSQYLLEHQGETKDCTFAPIGATGPSFDATLTIVAGPIGGEVNTVQVGSVTLGVVGEPVLVPAA
jgi:hypothetical protein